LVGAIGVAFRRDAPRSGGFFVAFFVAVVVFLTVLVFLCAGALAGVFLRFAPALPVTLFRRVMTGSLTWIFEGRIVAQ
jgi:hypothetical protein